jgi:hypothetical protein
MFELLLGHLVGDYLLQNQWMALNKSSNTLNGWVAAIIHCLLYTLAVCLFMWNFDWYWIITVFFSHFIIDKFKLVEYYLIIIKGRSLRKYINKDYLPPHYFIMIPNKKYNNYDILEGGFTAFVYAVADNTMHLILMWDAYKLFY